MAIKIKLGFHTLNRFNLEFWSFTTRCPDPCRGVQRQANAHYIFTQV